jgi:hypothetical protein
MMICRPNAVQVLHVAHWLACAGSVKLLTMMMMVNKGSTDRHDASWVGHGGVV